MELRFTTKKGAPNFHPRPGQFVFVDEDQLALAVEPDHGNFPTVGNVVTALPDSRSIVAAAGVDFTTWRVDVIHTDDDETAFAQALEKSHGSCELDKARCNELARAKKGGHPGACVKAGFTTKAHLLVSVDRLTPVLDLVAIPAARRKTFDPAWKPRA